MFNEFVYEMRWARSTTPNRSQKEKKKSMKQQAVAASSATRAREPYQHRPRHIKSSNSCYYATHSQPSPSCVCVWLCVVSSRPCKTGEPNKNNAECMQYIRCEHKIHLNIYMKSIWDHIFFSFSPNVYCNDELLLLIRIPNAASQVRKTRV